jgi:hypothetical protein
MGIGNKIVQLAKRMEMGARIICRDYNLDLRTIKKEVKERGVSVEFEGLKPNLTHPYKYWIYYDTERELFFAGYSEIATDQIGDQKPVGTLEQAMLETRIYLNKYNWTAKGAKYESVNFERGLAPVDSMEIGRVNERKIKAAYKQMKEACEEMVKEWEGEPPYMKIKENIQKEFVEIGIEYSPGRTIHFYYLVYVPDPDIEEGGTNWAAGYRVKYSKWPSPSPNVPSDDQDEIPYDTLEDAINKMKWWYKNL